MNDTIEIHMLLVGQDKVQLNVNGNVVSTYHLESENERKVILDHIVRMVKEKLYSQSCGAVVYHGKER